MSTDYKIGIIVGLVVLVAGVVYFLYSGEADKTEPPPIAAPTTAPNQVVPPPNAIEISLDTLPPTTAPTPTPPAGTVATPAETPAPTTAPARTGWILEEEEETAATAPPAATTAPAESGTVRIRVAPEAAENGFQLAEDAESAWEEPDLPPAAEPVIRAIPRPTETTPQVGPGGGTYTVRAGDNGFWIIAQRVYGPENGKYWTLIQKANPTVDTNALRVGQVLNIPPLPGSAGTGSPSGLVATAGTTEPLPATPSAADTTPEPLRAESSSPSAGSREYVVKEGDTGWGIAEKMYGKGQYWQHIQQANRGVRPEALRVGMKLVIPPLPSDSAPSASPVVPSAVSSLAPATTSPVSPSPAGRRGEVFTENGRRYYIVQSGDMGYWGIARKVYGDGKYSYLIDRANPGVDSYSLKPGDRLVVPPLKESATEPSRPASGATPPPAPPPAGVPDFGP